MMQRFSDPRRPEATTQSALASDTSLCNATDYAIRIPVAVLALRRGMRLPSGAVLLGGKGSGKVLEAGAIVVFTRPPTLGRQGDSVSRQWTARCEDG